MTGHWAAPQSNSWNEVDVEQLFQGLSREPAALEAETDIIRTFYRPDTKFGINTESLTECTAILRRWVHSAFPLKICMEAEYGFLFTPTAWRHAYQALGNAITRISAVSPEQFKFILVPNRQQADVLIRCCRGPDWQNSKISLRVEPSGEIRQAEISLVVPPDSAEAGGLETLLLYSLLGALGLPPEPALPSENPSQSGDALQTAGLPTREAATLTLLYRCPIGLDREALISWWKTYCQSVPTNPATPSGDIVLFKQVAAMSSKAQLTVKKH